MKFGLGKRVLHDDALVCFFYHIGQFANWRFLNPRGHEKTGEPFRAETIKTLAVPSLNELAPLGIAEKVSADRDPDDEDDEGFDDSEHLLVSTLSVFGGGKMRMGNLLKNI